MKINRKQALKSMAGLGLMGGLNLSRPVTGTTEPKMRTFRHSVCRWPYGSKSLEELCEAAVDIGIDSVELLVPEEYEIVKSYGLTCAMCSGVPNNLTEGFNNPLLHEKLKQEYFALFPKVADAGFTNVICFSGNRYGLDDETGLENSARGLEPVVNKAAEYGLTVSMELFNSKVDHKDYQADSTAWGTALCEKLGLDNFKLLYDIYHMQIMEGDVIRTLRNNIQYISHIHTGGVPGRNEIDDTQELNYKAIMNALTDLNYDGFVGQEFIPKNEDVFASLRQGVEICDV